MKKFLPAFIIAAALSCLTVFGAPASIKYTSASVYINNCPIPVCGIDGNIYIRARDLAYYGFDISFDAVSNRVDIKKSGSGEITGVGEVKLPWQRDGTVKGITKDTAIKTFVDGTEVKSYSFEGYMLIPLNSLEKFGSITTDKAAKAVFLTIPDLPSGEYKPLSKESPTYKLPKKTPAELSRTDYSVYPTKEENWGFVRVEKDEPRLYDWEKTMLEKYEGYYMDHSKPKAIYLTFDEGYEAGYTSKIMEILKKYDVPATFFVTGDYLKTSPQLVREMINSGFTVGNHTVNHKNLARCDVQTVMSELDGVSQVLKNDFGYETHYLRPPEGSFSEKSNAIARDMGYHTILWSFAYYDYNTAEQHGADYAYDMMTKYIHNGAIYLLHAVSSDNAAALERFILYAKENGYELRSLDELCVS